MSIANFIPEVWSARLLTSLKRAHVYAAPGVINRDYEGEIANAGDSVRITSVGRPTIGNYVPNNTVITPEQVVAASRTLIVDQSKYFAFKVDDVDKRQAKGSLMGESFNEAAYGLRDVSDVYVANFYSDVVAANALGTVAVTTPADAYDQLVELSVKLDEADVPTENRYAIIPPWYHGLLLKDNRFVGTGGDAAEATLRNGMVGTAAGFSIRKSNNSPNPTGDDYVVQVGHPMAITFADQIIQTEAYRPEDGFEDAVKGLHVYGAKLIRPYAIATMLASKT